MPRKVEPTTREKPTQIRFQINDVYKQCLTTDKSYIMLLGGRASGKSYFLEDLIIMKLISKPFSRMAIMRYIRADLADSLIQGLKDKIDLYNLNKKVKIQVSPFKITCGRNTIVTKFFKETSSSRTAQLKSLKDFTDVFIEEFEEVTDKEAFRKLSDTILRGVELKDPVTGKVTRIKSKIWMVSNPPYAGHWMVKEFLVLHKTEQEGYSRAELNFNHLDDTLFIFTTYKDNLDHLPEDFIQSFERRKESDLESYNVDVLGHISDGLIGRIFKDWIKITDKEYNDLVCPEVVYGLDFGYSNDPTACVEIKKVGNKLYVKQILYERELTNPQIFAELVKKVPNIKEKVIYADSSEPKSIQELQDYGLDIYPAEKGADSIKIGIQLIKQHEVYYTESSVDLETEISNYVWTTDRNKNRVNKPIDDYNHCFVGETLITTSQGQKQIKEITTNDLVLTRNGYQPVIKLWKNGVKNVVKYQIKTNLNTYTIECTPTHKFYTTNKNWVAIQKLQKDDIIWTNNQEIAQEVVLDIQVINQDKLEVYDITVANNHEYFANGMLVHNCLDSLRYCLRTHYNSENSATNIWGKMVEQDKVLA